MTSVGQAGSGVVAPPGPPSRLLLALASVAVAFGAADTYVVVLALPDMMTAAGLGVDQLQRAAPIVSGFLLGYVGVLPLIGRVADIRGRTPVLIGSLVVFALGSAVTAAAYDLNSVVIGRFVQGVGAGGLVPATLALVADLWPVERRGLPLGVVGAVQELGSVLGPLYGALVLSLASWRAIFWLNSVVAVVLLLGLVAVRGSSLRAGRDVLGLVLAGVLVADVVVVMRQPSSLVTDVTYGLAFVPVAGSSRWLSPLGLAALAILALFVLRQLSARRPLLAWRSWLAMAPSIDLPGAVALGLALAGVIVTFAAADPAVAVLPSEGPALLLGSAILAGVFAWRQRCARQPLIPRAALRARPAWGALLVSFLVGAALIAALVDIPFFARLTIYPDSQLDAALVLLRFLAALPLGALAGGWATRRASPAVVAALAMGLATAGFVSMAGWGVDALRAPSATIALVLTGLGFGAALAPINVALLAHTPATAHGVASALTVVARTVGMLVGISVLTGLSLHRFYDVSAGIPPVQQLCPADPAHCPEYQDRLLEAGIAQLGTVFVGAAVCASLAAVAALITLRRSQPARLGAPIV